MPKMSLYNRMLYEDHNQVLWEFVDECSVPHLGALHARQIEAAHKNHGYDIGDTIPDRRDALKIMQELYLLCEGGYSNQLWLARHADIGRSLRPQEGGKAPPPTRVAGCEYVGVVPSEGPVTLAVGPGGEVWVLAPDMRPHMIVDGELIEVGVGF